MPGLKQYKVDSVTAYLVKTLTIDIRFQEIMKSKYEYVVTALASYSLAVNHIRHHEDYGVLICQLFRACLVTFVVFVST